MTETTPNVAVIGAGRMGNHHARTYASIPECRLVAVVDKDLDRARTVASEHGGEPLDSVKPIIEQIDAASVCVPTVLHEAVAMPLIERRIPVLVEKPLAQDTTCATRLARAVEQYRTLLQVGHSERFNPVVQAMLRLEVEPRFIETHRISPFTFRSADISVVADMMIHDIDIVLHLVKRREYRIQAAGVAVLGPHEDVANARIRFDNGAVVNLTASRLALKTERKIRIFCPTAYLTMDYQKRSGIAIKLSDNLDLIKMARERNFEDLSQMANVDFGSMMRVEPLQVADTDPLRSEIEAFLKSIQTGDAPVVSAADGLAAVEMADRISSAIREDSWELDTP